MIKEQIKAIIKQYADKGARLFLEASESNESYAESYWDGYKDCADGLLREFDDMQEEPVSEDLEVASMQYGEELDNILAVGVEDDNSVGEYAQEAFKAGAKWQLKKAINWFKSNINCDIWIKDFIKNMEE